LQSQAFGTMLSQCLVAALVVVEYFLLLTSSSMG